MNRKHVALFAVVSLVSGVLPAAGFDRLNLLGNANNAQTEKEKPPPPPPPPPKRESKAKQGNVAGPLNAGASAAEKKKGKGGTKGGVSLSDMPIKKKIDVSSPSRIAPQRPKSVLGSGLLDNSAGFAQGGPSATGAPLAPSSARGGAGQVIK